jgi:hypothetical protein
MTGLYDHQLAEILADGHTLAPRELSALVHLESVKLADQIRRMCIRRKENIVIEGTLTWDGQGPRIFRELADFEYTDIEVYGLDIELAAAYEQALVRWWQGRLDWVNGADQLGDRFIPADAIDICYPKAGESICTSHVLQFVDTGPVRRNPARACHHPAQADNGRARSDRRTVLPPVVSGAPGAKRRSR